MPVYWWADNDQPLRVTPESPEARTQVIAALLEQQQIPYDARTLLALATLTWKAAGELAYECLRTSSIAAGRSRQASRIPSALSHQP